jgi:hypothetical protein
MMVKTNSASVNEKIDLLMKPAATAIIERSIRSKVFITMYQTPALKTPAGSTLPGP